MNRLTTIATKEHREVLSLLNSYKVYDYVLSNLHSGLLSIGFSIEFVSYFIKNFSSLDFNEFFTKYNHELNEVYDIGFFQKIIPNYFSEEVIPHIPESDTVLDLGCGTGILIHKLSERNKHSTLLGIDINEYPEWNKFEQSNIRFEVVRENDFGDFLSATQPDNIILTWTLHHMEYEEQKRYLKQIFDILDKGAKLIILEDSYTDNLPPKRGKLIYNSFMNLSANERKAVMSVYDWVANRILARRTHIPIPYGYRTLEEWKNLCRDIGYKIYDEIFIGFPDKRDINTPHCLFIIEK